MTVPEWRSIICMPLCKGALCSAAILVFIDYWNMVEQPLILLSDAEMHPLSVFLSKINSERSDWHSPWLRSHGAQPFSISLWRRISGRRNYLPGRCQRLGSLILRIYRHGSDCRSTDRKRSIEEKQDERERWKEKRMG